MAMAQPPPSGAVDFCPAVGGAPTATPAVGSTSGVAEFSCSACAQAFVTSTELRTHAKTERHLYNTKRKLAGLKPISQEAWERKVRESQQHVVNSKGTAHKKAPVLQAPRLQVRSCDQIPKGWRFATDAEVRQNQDDLVRLMQTYPSAELASKMKVSAEGGALQIVTMENQEERLAHCVLIEEEEKKSGGYAGTSAAKSSQAPARPPVNETAAEAEGSELQATSETATSEAPVEAWTDCSCLFDRRKFKTIDENLAYMGKQYCFFIPDQEYCTDVSGLLNALWQKISDEPHLCLYCNRKYPDLGSVRRHMIDKCHTRIGTEAKTRRGLPDKEGSEDLQDLLDEFYDYHASIKEITERMTDPKQRVSALLRYFDTDYDGRLNREEMGFLWTAMTNGAELSDAIYSGACKAAGADPKDGFDAEELGLLYSEGLADLDAHFSVLQDVLAKRRDKKAKGKAADGEPAIEEEDGEDDEDDDDSDGDTEVIECEDEDEFEEVMRVLGLEPVRVTETGDLRLPNGNVATNRSVQHIYKQRGGRIDNDGLVLYGGAAHTGGPKVRVRSQLMLSNANCADLRMAVSSRAQRKEGKRIVCILKKQQQSDMRLGMKRNLLLTNKRVTHSTGMGDHTGGIR